MKNKTEIYLGKVEECLSNHRYKVRVSAIDGSRNAPGSTLTSDLDNATYCTHPGICPNINVGDEVFVTYSDNDYSNPIIIGVAFNQTNSDKGSKVIASDLEVTESVKLPANTTIGGLTPSKIKYLANVSESNEIELLELRQDAQGLKKEFSELISWGTDIPTSETVDSKIYIQIIG